jgi:hypothetical protein
MDIKICHGCGGKGWIELSTGNVQICPVCLGCGQVIEGAAPSVPYPYLPRPVWPGDGITWWNPYTYTGCSQTSKPVPGMQMWI